jgi:catechol 2,3-dioxygenase-like lactoylglutathione lyase family enzyme
LLALAGREMAGTPPTQARQSGFDAGHHIGAGSGPVTIIEEFIQARLAEDEAAAHAAGADSGWQYPDPQGEVYQQIDEWHIRSVTQGNRIEEHEPAVAPADGMHIALHDPKRVLRQCSAIRRILQDADDAVNNEPSIYFSIHAAVASIWADHPDYRPGWA